MAANREMSSEEEAIRGLLERWAAAVRARDVERIVAHHSPDFWMFDVPPPFQSTGLEEYRRTWDSFYRGFEDPVVFDFDEMRITAGSDVAFVAARMHCEPTENGRRTRVDFRLTVGLRKTTGRWVITHEHHSVPAE